MSGADINGDGYIDILIGAISASPNGRTGAGEAYVIFGKANGFNTIDLASGLNSSQGFVIQGDAAGSRAGTTVRGMDINNDGYVDVIIGAPGDSPNGRTGAGATYVIFGKASGFATIDLARFSSGSAGLVIQGATAGDNSGNSIADAGDVNNDGYNDIIIGAYNASPNSRANAGISYVIFGKASGFATIDLASFSSGFAGFIIQGSTAGDNSGVSVAGSGDINNDGYSDVLIGAYNASPNGRANAGVAYAIFGKASGFATIDLANGLSNYQGFIVQGANAGDNLGIVSSSGDINGDGYSDVVIGAWTASPYGRIYAGSAYVIFGSPIVIMGTSANDVFYATLSTEKFTGNGGEDTVSYINSISSVTVDLTAGQGSGGYAKKDTYIGISDIIGSSYDDILIGNNAINNIKGGDGDDTIEGRGGADTIDGGNGANTLSYANSPAAVSVNLNAGSCSGGDAAGDSFTNFLNIIGSNYNDKLLGDSNVNTINGGSGNDIVQGNGGNDILYGGLGKDTFKITSLSGAAQIKDFDVSLGEQLDFSTFNNIHSMSDLSFEDTGNSVQIFFSNGLGEVVLSGVTSNQLNSQHFIFAQQPSASSSWWTSARIAAISSTLSAVGAILGIAYTLHQCKQSGAFCFKKKVKPDIGSDILSTVTAGTTVKAMESIPLKAKSYVINMDTQEQNNDTSYHQEIDNNWHLEHEYTIGTNVVEECCSILSTLC